MSSGRRSQDAVSSLLVSSAGSKVPLVVQLVEAMQIVSPTSLLVVGDTEELCPARSFAQGFLKMPPLETMSLEELVALLQQNSIVAVLPTRDGELLFWAKHKERLEESGIAVMVSSEKSVQLCEDKLAFGQLEPGKGWRMIPTSSSPEAQEADQFVVKERFGAGSIGLGLCLTREDALLHAKNLTNAVFQPFVSLPEISIDAYVTEGGEVHGMVLRHRNRVVHGESEVSSTFKDFVVESAVHDLLERLELRGPVVVQAFLGESELLVIEVNPRFGGASTVSRAVGLNLAEWSVRELLEPIEPLPSFVRTQDEAQLIRYKKDLIRHGPGF